MEANVLKKVAAALVALDAGALVALYSDDFAFEDRSSGESITDKLKLREYFDRLFALPGVKFSNVHFFNCGEQGAGEWTWSGQSRESGQTYRITGASIFTLSAGAVEREAVFYDPGPANA